MAVFGPGPQLQEEPVVDSGAGLLEVLLGVILNASAVRIFRHSRG